MRESIRKKILAHQSIAPVKGEELQERANTRFESTEATMNTSPNSAPTTPAKRGPDLNTRSLNLLLEQIFLLSLRKDASPPLKIVESGEDTLLNSRNLNDVVIMFLTCGGGEESNGAIGYLVSCFRRLIQKEASVSDKIRDEFLRFVLLLCCLFLILLALLSCKRLLVSFVATALTEPDLFGPSGLNELMKQIGIGLGGGSTDPVLVFLMKDLVDELIGLESFDTVCSLGVPHSST